LLQTQKRIECLSYLTNHTNHVLAREGAEQNVKIVRKKNMYKIKQYVLKAENKKRNGTWKNNSHDNESQPLGLK
jgi:hypothetical protein